MRGSLFVFRIPWEDNELRGFTFDPAFVIFVAIAGGWHGPLVLLSAIGPGLGASWGNLSMGVSSRQTDRTVLIVGRVPSTVSFDNDILHCVRCRVQDISEVPTWQSAYTRRKHKLVDLPVKYQLLRFQHLLADRAEPCCRLLHYAVPRHRIKTMGMDAFL